MEFRLYNKMNCTLFDMIGHKEPDQTKGLGYILAYSKDAMKIFLNLIQINKQDIQFLLSSKWVIECEQRQNPHTKKSMRTDIVIYFYNSNSLIKIIIIEAKGIKAHANSLNTINQLQNYLTLYRQKFPSVKNITCVTLTSISIIQCKSAGFHSLTWWDLINNFYSYANSKKKQVEAQLLSDYVNYLINI